MDVTPEFFVNGLLWYAVFILSTSAHEAAHAWTALRGGDPTASRGGQVTLNPAPHVRREPFGMVLVPILSFVLGGGNWMMGWASAPYDPYWAMRHPKRAALMSLAGPAANFLIAGLALVVLWIGLGADWFVMPDHVRLDSVVVGQGAFAALGKLLSIALMLNVILGVFNLIPVPPLDGHAAVPLFLSARQADTWRDWMRTIGFMGIVLAWLLMNRLFEPLFVLVLQVVYPGTSWS